MSQELTPTLLVRRLLVFVVSSNMCRQALTSSGKHNVFKLTPQVFLGVLQVRQTLVQHVRLRLSEIGFVPSLLPLHHLRDVLLEFEVPLVQLQLVRKARPL